MIGSKVDKKHNVKLTFQKAEGTNGVVIYTGKKKLNNSYEISFPKLKKLTMTTQKTYVHKKQKVGFEYWYVLRPYVVLGGKKLIGPELYTDLMMDYWLNDPFYDFEIVDINPPGFDTSWDW